MISFLLLVSLLANSAQPPETAPIDTSSIRVGLALSGGAALGLAHIGVLKVLEREGIDVCCIAGNSMGSLVGGLYAAGYNAAQLESIAVNTDFRNLFSSSIPFGAQYLPERQHSQRYIINLSHKNFVPALPSGLIPLQNAELMLVDLLSEIEFNTYYEFDSLPIPYRTIAVDLESGKLITLKNGRLQQAIRASIAIPGVFSPEIIDTLELVDGGVQQFLPVEPLFDFSPDLIIASTTIHSAKQEYAAGLIDIISRTMDLINVNDYQTQLNYADIVIEPDVDPFISSDFHKARALIAAGEAAAEQSMPAIREKIKERRIKSERKAIQIRPHPFVRSIRFNGLTITRASTVGGLVKTKPGMKLDFKRLHSDMTAIYHTGLFTDVNYTLEFMTPDSVAIIFEVREREYGFYAVGMRYDNTDNLVLGIEAGQANLWGAGASLRAALNLGNPREARFGLTGTRLFSLPLGYRIDIFRGSIKRPYFDGNEWVADYTITYHGAVAEAGYILGKDAFFDIGFSAKEALYRLPLLPVFDSLPASEWIIGPRFRFEYNTYDDLHLPSHGTAFTVDAVYSTKSLGAINDFIRIDLSFDGYMPLSSRVRLIPGFDLGLSFGTLAWESYFHTGGENLIGFENGYFTTQNRALLHLGLEYHILNFFDREDYPLYGQLLTDVGTFEHLDELLQSENIISNIHYGAGVGLRTNTPIGPFWFKIGAGDIGRDSSTNTSINYYISIGREFRYTR